MGYHEDNYLHFIHTIYIHIYVHIYIYTNMLYTYIHTPTSTEKEMLFCIVPSMGSYVTVYSLLSVFLSIDPAS